jgi:hypothetical protein
MLAAMLRREGLLVTMTDAWGQHARGEGGTEPGVARTVALYFVASGGDKLVGDALHATVTSVVARFRVRIRKGAVVQIAMTDHD